MSERPAIRPVVEEANSMAQEFYKLYYETLDKKRHLMNRLYLDTAVLIWEGNAMRTNTEIQKFYENLPSTTHSIMSVDAQPVPATAIPNQKTILVQVEGSVVIQHSDKMHRHFLQSFMITAVAGKWKIVSDCFRMLLDNAH